MRLQVLIAAVVAAVAGVLSESASSAGQLEREPRRHNSNTLSGSGINDSGEHAPLYSKLHALIREVCNSRDGFVSPPTIVQLRAPEAVCHLPPTSFSFSFPFLLFLYFPFLFPFFFPSSFLSRTVESLGMQLFI